MKNRMNKAPGNKHADLHVHTNYSDGMYSPAQVVETAISLDLDIIAITDHDSVEGVGPAIEAADGTELEVIPGIELSAAAGSKEIHLLGYFINWEDPVLLEKLEKMKTNREKRINEMVSLLREKGMDISDEVITEMSCEGTIGRLHLAQAMVISGLVKNTNEAFLRYIGSGGPCFVGHRRLEFYDAIKIIKKAGGVPVLAHPGSSGVDEFIPEFISAGLRGIEVHHTKHSASENERYMQLVRENSLIATGGSDCHGLKKGQVLMGKVRVEDAIVEELRAESEKIRSK